MSDMLSFDDRPHNDLCPMSQPTTLVLGASPSEERYSNKAIHALRRHGHPVVAVGMREATVADVPIVRSVPTEAAIDTVTMYLSAANQADWEERVLALHPKRVIFNPGAENPAFAARLQGDGVAVEEACTLVLLATGQY